MATERIDDDYRQLRGMDSLFVAGASVFPPMVAEGTCNTVMTIAERATELIRRRA